LFDEIEKAHPDVFNIFLQIFDECRLTDAQGRTVSFKNCIIIMTSNIGSDRILAASGGIDEKLKNELDDLLHAHFRPELLNRIDEIVYFKTLDQKDILAIIDVQLKSLYARLAEKHITLTITQDAKNWICEHGYVPEYGARPLKRALHEYVVMPLSKAILEHPEARSFECSLRDDAPVVLAL